MPQVFDPLPADSANQIICCYVNATSRIQIVRVTNIPSWYFERVVFPGQRLVFEALPEALLEIHTGMMASAILSDTLPCNRLRIHDEVMVSYDVEEQQRLEELNDGLSSDSGKSAPATITP
ncbi:DUF1830 domain-containing protein [Kovacikia minuta CCNUW1]|uniref:DUF1830 domain-containing protein n=1 Tax=Kovacikia minuta TaxID=2931930 RepID=UPI001CCD0EA0|nr:DUF1830 domain-containing protein [Kovacikia minuta]UBF28901.1 DUF1830 domain-containing protein [Kovacikia minuta CCNUW1]